MKLNEIEGSAILLVVSISTLVGITLCTRAKSALGKGNCLNSILVAIIMAWLSYVVCGALFPAIPPVLSISLGSLLDWEAIDLIRGYGIYLIMAKVLGPLYSLSASGTFKDNIIFKTSSKGTTAGGMPVKRKSTSPLQHAQQEKFKLAKDGWNSLDAPAKAAWAAAAVLRGTTSYRFFVSEYFVQNCVPPDLPDVP